MRGKAKLLANIEELKALAPLVRDAFQEEVSAVQSQLRAETQASTEGKVQAEKRIIDLEELMEALQQDKAAALEAAEQAREAGGPAADWGMLTPSIHFYW